MGCVPCILLVTYYLNVLSPDTKALKDLQKRSYTAYMKRI